MKTHSDQAFYPLREVPLHPGWKKGDVVVIFGELFQRGYVNGLVEEAHKNGAKIIFSTVGRRTDDGQLRPLTTAELAEKDQPLVNIPLEAGFDLEPSAPQGGRSPVDQLQGLKLSEWESAQLNWDQVQSSRELGLQSFQTRLKKYLSALEDMIPTTANVLFVHTMAGGVPRAKIVMPAMNRVFKGHGERYASSEEFWSSDMGKLCDASFMEVTAETFRHLINFSAPLRERQEKHGRVVSYVAYGYHGTEVLVGSSYHWQSYSPYLQGFAKLQLEKIAEQNFKNGLQVCVFNAPEILTNSSSIFLGVEVALYPLLGALQKEGADFPHVQKMISSCLSLLKDSMGIENVMAYTEKYFLSSIQQKWSHFSAWPQHNGPEQMALMRQASTDLIDMHQDPKSLMTSYLSEVVFKACGQAMWAEAWKPRHSTGWIGHDLVAKLTSGI